MGRFGGMTGYGIPTEPSRCPKTQCPYSMNGICECPRDGWRKQDSVCYTMSNWGLVKILKPVVKEPQ